MDLGAQVDFSGVGPSGKAAVLLAQWRWVIQRAKRMREKGLLVWGFL